ncbi:MAG TPA: FeoB small GTPase domain-containing protein, partial [Kiritimatiellia bacterium]
MPDFATIPIQDIRRKEGARTDLFTIALVGNPNAGKTTLFNALTGLRAKTANFPGTTVERKIGRLDLDGHHVHMLDLPGIYSLAAATPEEQLAADILTGRHAHQRKPDLALLVVDSTNLERNLFLVSQMLEHDIPVVAALNMIDIAEHEGIQIDIAKLSRELGCPAVAVSAKSGRGLDALREEMTKFMHRPKEEDFTLRPASVCGTCGTCPF